MKSREEYVRPYQVELEEYVQYIADVCQAAGYSSIDDAYDSILNKPVSDEEPTPFNGWQTAEDYYIMSLIDGIYDYEKQFYRAHKRYDRIIERLANRNKYNPVVAEEILKMKRRDERVKAYLEEVNRRHDAMIDELVSKYKTDVEEEDE